MSATPERIDHALALAADGKPDEADTLLAHLARREGDPLAAWHLGWLRLRNGDAEGALAILREFPADPLCSERAREMLVGERRNAEAMALLRQVPREAGEPRSLVASAIEHHLAGRYPAAVDACRQALRMAPAHAPAHNHLGRALHNLGQTAAALTEFEKAVHADPRYPEAWHNLGHSLRARNDIERSCEALQRALALAPGYRSARLNLGINLFTLDQFQPALECFEALLKRNRDDVEALANAGLCLQLLGEPGKARQRYERALELAPDNQWAHFYLGVLLSEQGEPAAAQVSLRRALVLRPDDPDAWAELAAAHEACGELEPAEAAVQSGLKVAPVHVLVNIQAAKLERRRGDSLGAEARLLRLDTDKLPSRVRQRYQHELGRVLDRNARSDAAFEAFEQANRLAAADPRWRKADREALFNEIHEIEAWLAKGAHGIAGVDDGDGDVGADLCFLVGFPHSDHRLLGSFLGALPGLAVLDERATLEPVIATITGLPGGYPEAIGRLDRSDRLALRRMYRLALARQGVAPGQRVLDRSPLRTIHAGLVQALFPKAQLLFALRHPCDVVIESFIHAQALHAAGVNFHTLEDCVRSYEAVLGLWHQLQPHLAMKIGGVRYERLESSPETELAATCRFLGLDWDPALLEGAQRLQQRMYRQRSAPAYWKRYRGPLQPYLARLAPHAARLGYTLD